MRATTIRTCGLEPRRGGRRPAIATTSMIAALAMIGTALLGGCRHTSAGTAGQGGNAAASGAASGSASGAPASAAAGGGMAATDTTGTAAGDVLPTPTGVVPPTPTTPPTSAIPGFPMTGQSTPQSSGGMPASGNGTASGAATGTTGTTGSSTMYLPSLGTNVVVPSGTSSLFGRPASGVVQPFPGLFGGAGVLDSLNAMSGGAMHTGTTGETTQASPFARPLAQPGTSSIVRPPAASTTPGAPGGPPGRPPVA